jgi:hypothetical protein
MSLSKKVFENIHWKLRRADQLAWEFDAKFRSYIHTNPFEVTEIEDRTTNQRRYVLTGYRPPHELTIALLADFLHNLRTPLDQIAYQVAVDANAGKDPGFNVYFPIAVDEAKYLRRRNSMFKTARLEILQAMDSLQPYKGGRGGHL